MSAALVRALTAVSVAEMALTRRDTVAGALLSQAARAGEGLPGERAIARAADIVRAVDVASPEPTAFACRKVAQALCRLAVHDLTAALLAGQSEAVSTARNAAP